MAENISSAGKIIKAASACVWRDGKVLLVQRGRPPGKGVWSLPGGKLDVGEAEREAATRELHEETGVSADLIHLVGVFPIRLADGGFDIHCFAGVAGPETAEARSDAMAVRFVTIAEAEAMALAPHTLIAIRSASNLLESSPRSMR